MKLQHGAREDGVDAPSGLPPPEGTIEARMVDFRATIRIAFDRQLLPLTAHVEQPKNVVEDLEQTQLRCWPTATEGQVRQDKLLKQSAIQLRGDRLPSSVSSHSATPESWILPGAATPAEKLGQQRLLATFPRVEKPATSCGGERPERVGVL